MSLLESDKGPHQLPLNFFRGCVLHSLHLNCTKTKPKVGAAGGEEAPSGGRQRVSILYVSTIIIIFFVASVALGFDNGTVF